MTATDYIRLSDFFKHQLHINDELKAKVFVEEIEKIVDDKVDEKSDGFAKKSEIEKLDFKIELLRQEMKTGFAETKSELKSDINRLVIWIIGIVFTAAVAFFAISKFL